MTLSAEMRAEHWIECGDQSIELDLFWVHPPTKQCVHVVSSRRREWRGPTWGPEPWSPEVRGYCVTLRVHDEWGNPISGEGFWHVSRDVALKLAREIRRYVLGERDAVADGEQIGFGWDTDRCIQRGED